MMKTKFFSQYLKIPLFNRKMTLSEMFIYLIIYLITIGSRYNIRCNSEKQPQIDKMQMEKKSKGKFMSIAGKIEQSHNICQAFDIQKFMTR